MQTIDVEKMFKVVILDEITISILLSLLDKNGISEKEASQYVLTTLPKIEKKQWEEATKQTLNALMKDVEASK